MIGQDKAYALARMEEEAEAANLKAEETEDWAPYHNMRDILQGKKVAKTPAASGNKVHNLCSLLCF